MYSLYGPPLGTATTTTGGLSAADENTVNLTYQAATGLVAKFPASSFNAAGIIKVDLVTMNGQALPGSIPVNNLNQIRDSILNGDTSSATGTTLAAQIKAAGTLDSIDFAMGVIPTGATPSNNTFVFPVSAVPGLTGAYVDTLSPMNLFFQTGANATTRKRILSNTNDGTNNTIVTAPFKANCAAGDVVKIY